jgi:hypothetical protein
MSNILKADANEKPEITRYLEARKWTKTWNLGLEFDSPDEHWRLYVHPQGNWVLWFKDEGKLHSIVGEGQTLDGLRATLQAEDAAPWECPNCGEMGGTPVEVRSREWQGDEAQGGMVTWVDEGCSLCSRPSGPDPDQAYDQRVDMRMEEQECPF